MAKMWKKTLALAMATILLLSMAGCGEKGEPEQEQSVEEEQQLPEEEPQADADQDPQLPQFGEQIQEAREKNEDIIGWLKIDDTEIDGAVVQGENNQYYEVKSERAGQTVNTANQMLKYDTSIISAKRYQDKNIVTSPTRGTTPVSGTFAYGLYDVTYKLDSAGLITYRCELNSNRTLALAIVLVGALCVATGNLPGAAGAGALIPALV